MILSRSYFKGLISISNATDIAPNSNLLGNIAELDLFIQEHERDYLSLALGYSNYKGFRTSYDDSGKLIDAAEQKWKDLMNGKEYTKEGVLLNWRGLVFSADGLKMSPMADYVYYHFLESDLSRHRGVGVIKEKSKGSVIADPAPKAVKAWTRFYQQTVEGRGDQVSLYQFICDMNEVDKNTYPNWVAYDFGQRNIMGI